MRFGNLLPVFSQTFKMKFDGFLDHRQGLFSRFSRRDATGEIGHVRGPAGGAFFQDYNVMHDFTYFLSPACFRALFNVPAGMSTLGLSDTVTVPDLLDA